MTRGDGVGEFVQLPGGGVFGQQGASPGRLTEVQVAVRRASQIHSV
ncbi:hypothetical protein [Amycolatopsis circi]|nr:hypothetical protein [Amycolatopsis circi]